MTTKLMIPALLLGVVMIAGAFAFMPVQEASTVHTSAATTSTQMAIFEASDTVAAAAATVVTISADGSPFRILGISFSCTTADPSSSLEITTCENVDEDMDVASYVRDSETTAQLVVLTAVAGADSDGTSTLFLDGNAAILISDIHNLVANTDIAFTMENDVIAGDSGDNGYTLTVNVIIETVGSVTFDAADIAFSIDN